ncbi:MAG: FAD-binding protein, partial [Acidimicrobiia bacterium]|nr:FAD-binding protein [Acidimicrobiia bacterium]
MSVLVFVETVEGIPTGPSLVALTASRPLGVLQAVVTGDVDLALLGAYGVQFAHRIDLDEYAPQAWGAAVAQVATDIDAKMVIAPSTARGNEVLAHAAVDLDQPFAANCLTYDQDTGNVLRIRWGGSLYEDAVLEGSPAILSFSQFAVEESAAGQPASTTMIEGNVSISDEAMVVTIVDQEQAAEGVTLATARLVVSGGRGVGSAEGFAILDELAGMLGGKVGCSRVVTNNGWRPHADQVGQTGTVVA